LKRVRFTGPRRKGTLDPRRVWYPGEVIEVDDRVADELAMEPDFIIVKARSRRKLGEKK